jgi:patatin-like phospholipase/acyl hydrolase
MGKQLCLLSLDGGGVRGLSTLLILKRLMEGVNPTNPPKPCQYFHMIGGTSTGGLIALMLGRMRLSVDDCIAAYTDLSPKIFTKLHHRVKLSNGESQGRFDHEALEQGIRALLKKYGFEEDALLKESLDAGTCKT